MFKRKTVFIVGAGGSNELDLPMGEELKGIIAEKVDFRFDRYEPVHGDRKIYHAIQHLSQSHNRGDPNLFFRAGQDIAEAMPLAISIDNFLHTHSENSHIVETGKLGIAAAILDAERKSSLFRDPTQRDEIDFSALRPSWHTVFCKMLLENVKLENAGTIFDNVSFITFNYDRCIERYVAAALKVYLRIPIEEAQQHVRNLKIIHPYGKVGILPSPYEAGGIPFGADIGFSFLPEVASQIRTFTERFEDPLMMAELKAMVQRAEQIVFLGFSYGSMNLQLLKFEKPFSDFVGPWLIGTSKGLSVSNSTLSANRVSETFNRKGPERTTLIDLTCEQLLNDHWLAITQ